jgi:hypothetical protein
MSRTKDFLISVSEELGFNGHINSRVCREGMKHARRLIQAQEVQAPSDEEVLRMADDLGEEVVDESYHTPFEGSWWKCGSQ